MTKIRANLYLDKDIYERAKKLANFMPGAFSVSQSVEQFLSQMLSVMEPFVEKAKAGDKEAAYQLFKNLAADGVINLGESMNVLRTELQIEETPKHKKKTKK